MEKGKDIIGWKVFSLKEDANVGAVEDIIYDPEGDEVIAFVLVGSKLKRGRNILAFEDVDTFEEGVVVVPALSVVKKPEEISEIKNLVGQGKDLPVTESDVATGRGLFLGQMGDFSIDKATGDVLGLDVLKDAWESGTAEGEDILGKDKVLIGASSKGLGQEFYSRISDVEFVETQDKAKEGRFTKKRVGREITTGFEDLASRQPSIEEKAEDLTERVKKNWIRISTSIRESAQKREDEYRQKVEDQLVSQVVGHPVGRVILDRSDNVILNKGDIITYGAIKKAKEAGVLQQIFDSAEK